MITRKLSKHQGYIVQGLVENLAQLQAKANEEQAALASYAELLRAHFDLPAGETNLAPGPDGWSINVKPAPPEPEAKPEPETPEPEPEVETDDKPPGIAEAA